MSRIRPPRQLFDFAETLGEAGKRCYLVGGAVRDYFLGRPVSDFDVATDARPEEVMGLYRRVIPTGIKHGTVTVLWKGLKIEATTFRTEADYSDGRHPDRVEYAATIEEDLGRRDFTMNAMAFDLLGGSLLDPYGGEVDLGRALVRAVGDPVERFREDGLRPLRALRFAAQLGFEVEAATLAAIPAALDRFKMVSAERVRDELQKMLLSPGGSFRGPSRGLRLMESSGMLELVLPELAACRGVEQRGRHRFDVLDHLYESVDAAPAEIALRLAALFHDLGKPAAKVENPGAEPSFHRHEEYSAEAASGILKRLRFPNGLHDEVVHLVRHHMFAYDDSWSDAAVRRFLARVGADTIDRLFALRLADGAGMTGLPVDPRSLEPFRERIGAVLAESHAFGLRDLAVDGEELASIGVPKGPVMGRILAELLETVLDDPGLNEKARLLDIAGKLKKKYGIA
jgi:tRNA nucleotidyltransferase/poly(A) polymerase